MSLLNATRIILVGTPFSAKAIAESLVAMPRIKVRKNINVAVQKGPEKSISIIICHVKATISLLIMQICKLAWQVNYMLNVLGHRNTLAKFHTKCL